MENKNLQCLLCPKVWLKKRKTVAVTYFRSKFWWLLWPFLKYITLGWSLKVHISLWIFSNSLLAWVCGSVLSLDSMSTGLSSHLCWHPACNFLDFLPGRCYWGYLLLSVLAQRVSSRAGTGIYCEFKSMRSSWAVALRCSWSFSPLPCPGSPLRSREEGGSEVGGHI